MGNSRQIVPSFFQNDQLGACPPQARLLFIGLLTLADFNGVAEYRPSLFKAAVFPYDEIDIEPMIEALQKMALIVLVAPSQMDAMYVWIPRFTFYQKITKRERDAGTNNPSLSELGIEINGGDEPKQIAADESPLRDPRDLRVFAFPCLKTKSYPSGWCAIPRRKANEWHSTYGLKLNIIEEIRRCRQWVLDKPERRSEGGQNSIARIGNWLRKSDRDGTGVPPLTRAELMAQRERLKEAHRQDDEQRARVRANTAGRTASEPSTFSEILRSDAIQMQIGAR